MARIPDSEIERLKVEVSVERLVESSGIALKKAGKDLTCKCPFHEDDTASLVVTPAKNLWHCFGCGAAGGPIDWVIKKNGVSFRHAVELLRDGVPSLAAGSGAVKHSTVRSLPAPVSFDADDRALMNQVADYYHETLKQSPEALAYLEARGFAGTVAMDAIATFKLGYANRTLGLRLPQKNRVAGSEIRTRLQKVGLYRESGHEHFNGSLVVPILDESGNVVEMYGRKIRDDLRKGTPKHLYLAEECRAGSRGVFNIAALQANKEIILCEALIDALTFWCAGYRNVTSSYGIECFTEDMLAAFKAHGTDAPLAVALTGEVTDAAQVYYIHADHLDTPRQITDTAGNVVWQWDNSDPFGNNVPNENPSGQGTFVNNLGFPGQYRDKETNTAYNIYRDHYFPDQGRYGQSDPAGLYGGSWSTYTYVGGNPLIRIDPLGLEWQFTAGIGGSIGGHPIVWLPGPFVGGGASFGFTSGGQFILQFQATGSVGVGLYAGVGGQLQVSKSSCPTPSGISVSQSAQGDFNFGAGPTVGGSLQYNKDGGGLQTGAGKFGAGVGLQTSVGVTQTVTIATPALF